MYCFFPLIVRRTVSHQAMPVKLVYGGKLTQSDPKDFPVVIVGQLPHLTSIGFDDVKIKLAPRVNKEVGGCVGSDNVDCKNIILMY